MESCVVKKQALFGPDLLGRRCSYVSWNTISKSDQQQGMYLYGSFASLTLAASGERVPTVFLETLSGCTVHSMLFWYQLIPSCYVSDLGPLRCNLGGGSALLELRLAR